MWKEATLILIGMITAGLFVWKFGDPSITNVQGDLIESQKVKDNYKYKDHRKRKGILGWLKRDPDKKEARKKKREEKRNLRKMK